MTSFVGVVIVFSLNSILYSLFICLRKKSLISFSHFPWKGLPTFQNSSQLRNFGPKRLTYNNIILFIVFFCYFHDKLSMLQLLYIFVPFFQAHTLQLEAFSLAIQRLDSGSPKPKLVFVGGCRNISDQERLNDLQNKSIELNMEEYVEFHRDISYRSSKCS